MLFSNLSFCQFQNIDIAYQLINSINRKDFSKIFYLKNTIDYSRIVSDTTFIFADTTNKKNDLFYKTDSLFSLDDIKSFREQLQKKIAQEWTDGKIYNAILIKENNFKRIFNKRNNDKSWNIFYKKYGKGFYVYSYPIFSKNLKKAIISIEYHCGGLCGSGGVYLFEFKDNNWLLLKTYSQFTN